MLVKLLKLLGISTNPRDISDNTVVESCDEITTELPEKVILERGALPIPPSVFWTRCCKCKTKYTFQKCHLNTPFSAYHGFSSKSYVTCPECNYANLIDIYSVNSGLNPYYPDDMYEI